MIYGVTPQGFVAKTRDEIKAEVESELRSAFGPALNLAPQSVFGTLAGIMTGRESVLWELGEGLWLSGDPDAAADVALNNIMAITGVQRLGPRESLVTLTATGAAGTVLPVGRQASVNGARARRFETTQAAVIAALPAWVASTAYAVGDRVASNARVWLAVTAGASGGSAPAGSADFDDGGVLWRLLGLGVGAVDVPAQATVTGPIAAPSGTVTEIETPVAGWAGVVNVLDAIAGRDKEPDPAARDRREDLLASAGSSIIDAVRGRVRSVPLVEAVTVFENTSDSTDADGIPPHAVEALVVGGDADAVAQAIWGAKPAGIRTHGLDSGTAVDAQGSEHVVFFTVPAPIDIYVHAVVERGHGFPADGADQVREALLTYGQTRGFGDDVVASALSARAFMVPGVADVAALYIGTSPGPVSGATIPISVRQIAAFDSSRVTVAVLP